MQHPKRSETRTKSMFGQSIIQDNSRITEVSAATWSVSGLFLMLRPCSGLETEQKMK